MHWTSPIAVLLLSATLAACGCGSNAHAIAMANSLTPARLEQLAHDLKDLKTAKPGTRYDDETGIPKAFQDLHPSEVIADRLMPRVLLSGCVDDKVSIFLRDGEGNSQQLMLQKGELEGQVVLWSGR